jgi:hypothetical protein
MDQHVLSWDAPEYHHVERTADWYWMLGIIAVSITVLCILVNNILFGLFILLGALSAGMYASKEPKVVNFELQPRGILANKLFYPYNTLDSFWIDEHHPLPRIVLKSKKTFSPHITIPLSESIHSEEVRQYLVQHIAEVEHNESYFHRLLEHIGL